MSMSGRHRLADSRGVLDLFARWKIGTRARLLLRGLRYAELLPYASIDGWLSVDEAITLYELARALPAAAVAVEIGSWQGKSSVVLGRGLLGNAGARLFCIDPFDASGDLASAGDYRNRAASFDNPLKQGFMRNLVQTGVREVVEVLQGYSHDVVLEFRRPIDLLFLDGNHSYEGVLRDYRDWGPKVQPGGLLCLHDVVHPTHEGPRRLVDEVLASEPFWVEPRYVDSMFVVRKAARS